MTDTRRRFCVPREVIQTTGLPRDLVYRLLHSGILPSVRVGERFYIPASAVDTLVARIEAGEIRKV